MNIDLLKCLEVHPIANKYPMMDDQEYSVMLESIREFGQQSAIYLFEGKILDGRNRHKALCQLFDEGWTGEIKIEDFTGAETQAVMFSDCMNLKRRHLTGPQKAVLAVRQELAKEKAEAKQRQEDGQKIDGGKKKGKAIKLAAQKMGTNHDYVNTVNQIDDKAPELVDRIYSKEIDLKDAKALSNMDEVLREKILSKMIEDKLTFRKAEQALGISVRSKSQPVLRQASVILVDLDATQEQMDKIYEILGLVDIDICKAKPKKGNSINGINVYLNKNFDLEFLSEKKDEQIDKWDSIA